MNDTLNKSYVLTQMYGDKSHVIIRERTSEHFYSVLRFRINDLVIFDKI